MYDKVIKSLEIKPEEITHRKGNPAPGMRPVQLVAWVQKLTMANDLEVFLDVFKRMGTIAMSP